MIEEVIRIEASVDELSPYDASYPAKLLSHRLKERLTQAHDAAGHIYNAVMKHGTLLVNLQQRTEKGVRYVVDMSEGTLEAIESGRIKFSVEKSGKTFAQIRQKNGHYGEKFPIRREEFGEELNPSQIASSLQMSALQSQVEALSLQLDEIGSSLSKVLEGQQNDRMALYYSGLSMYLEASSFQDEATKRQALLQAMQTLTQGSWQLRLQMESDVRFLASYADKRKRKSVQEIDDRMQSIEQSFAVIHQASLLRAGVYCEMGEMAAMATVLQEYSCFIDQTVAKNANLLSQCDVRDTGTATGVWSSRAEMRLDAADLAKQLKAPEKTLYLSMEKEN